MERQYVGIVTMIKKWEDTPLTPNDIKNIMDSPGEVKYLANLVIDKMKNLTGALDEYVKSDYTGYNKPQSFYLEHLIEYMKKLQTAGDFYQKTKSVRRALTE